MARGPGLFASAAGGNAFKFHLIVNDNTVVLDGDFGVRGLLAFVVKPRGREIDVVVCHASGGRHMLTIGLLAL